MPLDFTIDRNSSVPLHEQIKDRVKVGLALGTLRPGDNLPSIRQLEAKIQVGTAVIRKAYRDLAAMDILDLQHGRGVYIKDGVHRQAAATVREYEVLCNQVYRELDRANLVPSSFARFLHGRILDAERQTPSVAFVEDSKTLSADHAAQLGQEWQIPISAFSLTELRDLPAVQRAELRRVLTSYYHVDEVREIMRKHRAKVIPVNVEFRPEMEKDLGGLPARSRIMFVIQKEDFAHLSSLVATFLEDKFGGLGFVFEVVSSGEVGLQEVLRRKRHARVLVSNRIWDDLKEELRASPRLSRARLQVTRESVKSAWGSIGVI